MTPEVPEAWVWVPFEVDKTFDGYRIDRFLSQRLHAYSRAKVQKILEQARVVKEGRPVRASSKVHAGDKIQVAYLRRPEAALAVDAALPVLYEDDDLLVVNKPSGLLSHPTDKVVLNTVLGVLRHSRPDLPKIHLLHRLDRETSGVLSLAKNAQAARRWTSAMEDHRMQKEYLAVVHGRMSPAQGVLDAPIGRAGGAVRLRQWVNAPGAVPAITRYKVLSRTADKSVVRAFPKTGRLHQIRVHFAASGHPILGDVLYPGDGELYLRMIEKGLSEADRLTLGCPRLALHAASLSFEHPRSGRRMTVTAPVPPDLQALLQEIRNSDKLRPKN